MKCLNILIHTVNTENLLKDMFTYLGGQYQCKVCGNTEKEKHAMEEHTDSHLEENSRRLAASYLNPR